MNDIMEIEIITDESIEENKFIYLFHYSGKVVRFTFDGDDLIHPQVFDSRGMGEFDRDAMIENDDNFYSHTLTAG